jgi:hypothetical protein
MKIVYYQIGKNVQAYFEVDGYLIPYSSGVCKEDQIPFDTKCYEKREAKYNAMLYCLRNGKTINSYKISPYYDYYVERLKKEHPEFLI